MWFELLSPITDIETFAIGTGIREIRRLEELYGAGRWRKRKGRALIRLADGTIGRAELHWYEASGIGRRDLKFKCFLD